LVAVPNTVTRMSHALTIRVGSRIVGAVHSFAPSMSRTVDTEFEVERGSHGMPVDLVPQAVENRELRVDRYDTYPEIMEEVFGTSELAVLADQYQPFTIREMWRGPPKSPFPAVGSGLAGVASLAGSLGLSGAQRAINQTQYELGNATAAAASSSAGAGAAFTVLGTLTADTRVYVYTGCWFSNIGRTIDAKNDRVVSVAATLIYLDRFRVL